MGKKKEREKNEDKNETLQKLRSSLHVQISVNKITKLDQEKK